MIDLDYGKHKRPTQKQARELALLCVQANKLHKLTRAEIRAHLVAALAKATTNGPAYLLGALKTDNLPIHTPKKRAKTSAAKPDAKKTPATDINHPDFYQSINFDQRFMPKRLSTTVQEHLESHLTTGITPPNSAKNTQQRSKMI